MVATVAGEKLLWSPGLLHASVWLALHGEALASAGNEFSAEAGAGFEAPNYARIEIAGLSAAAPGWTVSNVTGAASNAAALAFADPGAGNEWPGALALALWTAAVGGEPIDAATILGAPLVAAAGDPVAFAIGQLIVDV